MTQTASLVRLVQLVLLCVVVPRATAHIGSRSLGQWYCYDPTARPSATGELPGAAVIVTPFLTTDGTSYFQTVSEAIVARRFVAGGRVRLFDAVNNKNVTLELGKASCIEPAHSHDRMPVVCTLFSTSAFELAMMRGLELRVQLNSGPLMLPCLSKPRTGHEPLPMATTKATATAHEPVTNKPQKRPKVKRRSQ